MREVIARRIIEMVQNGEINPQTLAEQTVLFVNANYKDPREGKT